MTYTAHGLDFEAIGWTALYTSPSLVRHLIAEDGTLPDWLIEYRQSKLEPVPFGDRRNITFVPRAKDCTKWIKNNCPTGIRKRVPEIRLPKKRSMPRPLTIAQYQGHALHLLSRVLNIRLNASPFTLIVDDLSQRATPLTSEIMRRALSRNINVVVVAFEAADVDPAIHYIPAYGGITGAQLLEKIEVAMSERQESLVVVDSLYDLVNATDIDMGVLFDLVATRFASTLVGIYHQDILADQYPENAYAPQHLEYFQYLATTIFTCKSLAHVLAAKAASERSLAEPTFGLLQGAEGVVQCLDANDHRGIVFTAEFRRKSGRPESETFFLRETLISDYNEPLPLMRVGTLKQEFAVLIDQVPAYANEVVISLVKSAADAVESNQATDDLIESTFNLSITDKQKEARDGVILPYFDAQTANGGEGGRILYDMSMEDDFDEEEDEI
ncbi:Elongator subunit Iki1-domain-containing protein [Massariosphaeria phaeospora]|uniref:Elongator complex protein 5 n=1 Tax=Massariosphaeria phaeospora TaxID=100035 RepID=A0A7C8MWC5_9PLEO|nr:Elongator subunit Iki1-domain-containing protein [Massariosphaeria phaeospora]